ncbi:MULTISPECIES: TetR/AcrR family transcriptional regulator [unclassified Streptomyces]|uniref:TetR/AcrR family transcriptional regulator n=1 Tax=unclassified Streptomyces TaxID=2593676 RepID=UPI0013CD92DD|nr:TetR/AcrR family transcriptional regulator [Streptomyces sp. SID8499]NED37818.1 TetR family transcriptional regulator [Streptomyces sp. SID8499]NED73875.1 TetR family transcriptional regulator [Streptomyces sp. SID9944]
MSNGVRQKIMAATLDLIGERGIGGVSNRAVAKTAQVSLGTLTYHFTSQEELLGQALRAFVDDEIDRLSHIADRVERADVSLQEALELARESIEERPGRHAQIAQLELYLHATRDDGLREAAARCYAAYDRLSTAVLRAMGVSAPERLAPLLGALIDGLELRRLAVDDLPVGIAEGLAILVDAMPREPAARASAGSIGTSGH